MADRTQHFVDLDTVDRAWVERVFQETDQLLESRGHSESPKPLSGRTVAGIFHKPSLRTRISFAAGVTELFLDPNFQPGGAELPAVLAQMDALAPR